MTDNHQEEPQKINLKKLDYSPAQKPFLEGSVIKTKRKTVRTKSSTKNLIDPDTGEVVGQSVAALNFDTPICCKTSVTPLSHESAGSSGFLKNGRTLKLKEEDVNLGSR